MNTNISSRAARLTLVTLLAGGALALSGCSSLSRKDTATVVGATAGAVVGGVMTGTTTGAALGAAAGGLIGNEVGKKR
ncbi:MAG: glycine zipper 2TM domain-containing protein [Roseateles sp.]|nr:MAG: glycine zipper 2TM domain-containing protein [Roseateles sp.]